ncbi:DUF1254 domain-containing protein [Hyphomicrobium sp. D-2]|uniref:DUF1254 domain-containing protein n=1 Tax=Hyphomicrobium sp. D-2 TaxID=3041621 RepID=UPI00245463A1|nr:DUF1254 domain-containing protein [Hyphomicrobium sp. D-2]MDH4981061.1 DUF1254 domain-containing protein [Hyphomicrobium sp. D-2]
MNASPAPKTSTVRTSTHDVAQIAHDAYLYAFPMVENYLTLYQWVFDTGGSQYKGPPNAVHNEARVFTPNDTGIVTPNSDTPYSFLCMDLRAEPLVVTLPPIENERYYSIQLIDLYTHNVDYIGTRRDGNAGGSFLIAGPDWNGDVPDGIKRVVRMPTSIAFALYRTQLIDDDIAAVKRIQAGYKAVPLSKYIGSAAPVAAPAIDWPPISRETMQSGFWRYVNFLLQFAVPLPWEAAERDRFATIGIAAGAPWPPPGMPDDLLRVIDAAGHKAHEEISDALMQVTSSTGLFGTPDEMRGKELQGCIGAMGGLFGNSDAEALYPSYLVDGEGRPLDTSKYDYRLTFPADGLPPVDAFWSVTMYDGTTRFLVHNPLRRYLINSSMLPDLQKDDAGRIVIYMQKDSPGKKLEANWLPAPDGPMAAVMRLYLPKPSVLNGTWKAPLIETIPRR